MVLFEPVMAAVLRIATHPAIYKIPATRDTVEKYLPAILSAPAAVPLRAGEATHLVGVGINPSRWKTE